MLSIGRMIGVMALVLLLSGPAIALSLKEAKIKGWVGERQDGYLGLVVKNSEATQLVKTINSKRRAKYQQVANKNNLSLEQVGKLASEKARKLTRPGHYIQDSGGKWVVKK